MFIQDKLYFEDNYYTIIDLVHKLPANTTYYVLIGLVIVLFLAWRGAINKYKTAMSAIKALNNAYTMANANQNEAIKNMVDSVTKIQMSSLDVMVELQKSLNSKA